MNLGRCIGELQLRVWQLEDDLEAARRRTHWAPTRERIFDAIREAGRPLTAREIAARAGLHYASVTVALTYAHAVGCVTRQKSSGSGRRSYAYSIPGDTPHGTPEAQEDTRC